MFFRSFEELSIDDSWLSWPGRKLTVSPCTSWQRGPMPFGTAVYPTRLPELPFLTNVRKNIRIKRRKTLSLFGETPTKMWWCLPSACTSSELQQMAPLWLLTSQHCHKNFDCLYHRCLHFQSFLPPKEKYIIGNLPPCFLPLHYKRTQLVTGRYIVSTNTTSNQQGRLRIEPPTSRCRQDIRGRLGLTPRKLEQYLYH